MATTDLITATTLRIEMLTQERLKGIIGYDPETGEMWRIPENGRKFGHISSTGYLVVSIDNYDYKAHRLAWLYVYGTWPSQIDHVNGDRADNRLINLRIATNSQNQANGKLRVNNKTGTRGVSWNPEKRKWRVRTMGPYGRYILKDFDNEYDAKAFAVNTHKELHGEYSALNRRE